MNTPANEKHEALSVSMVGVTLEVADIERSLEFYKQIPGARVLLHRPGGFALLAIGNGRLGLLKQGVGPTHLEFDILDVDALYQQFKATGFPVEEPPTQKGWGEYDFVLHDPDGHCLEFNRPHDD
ncbi:MAG TPA: VOC family protein [Ktedonosporobacter sp.]|nr:VOC family protein [Ktedonosporobacter sp.]